MVLGGQAAGGGRGSQQRGPEVTEGSPTGWAATEDRRLHLRQPQLLILDRESIAKKSTHLIL